MNISQATDLVLQANTQRRIAAAIEILRYPATHLISLNITSYQREMLIDQLNINGCSLEVNGHIQ